MNVSELKDRVQRRPWAQAGYFPAPAAVRWPGLDESRERHEQAVAALAAAKGSAIEPAVAGLCEVVEEAVEGLRTENGFGWSAHGESTYDRVVAEAMEPLVPYQDPLRKIHTGTPPEDVREVYREPYLLALAIRDDVEMLVPFLQAFEREQNLLGAEIVPAVVAEARAFREELTKVAA